MDSHRQFHGPGTDFGRSFAPKPRNLDWDTKFRENVFDLVIGAMFLFAIIGLCYGLMRGSEEVRYAGWKECQGVVTVRDEGRMSCYDGALQYDYQVAGETYRSGRWRVRGEPL